MASSTKPKKTKTDRRVVSFELPDDMLEVLDQDAKARSAKSRHIRARDIVVQALSHKETEDLAQQLGELDARVAMLKTMIQKLAYAVIVYAAGKSPTDANAWIREHLTN